MEITEIKIYKMENRGKLLAYASVVFNNSIVLRGLKIINGAKGTFVAMPSRLDRKTRTYREYFHPINSDARKYLSDSVLKAYEEF